MKEIILHPLLTAEEIEAIAKRYHFKEMDYQYIMELYAALKPLVRTKCFFARNPQLDFIKNENYVLVILTLGQYVDSLEMLYSEAERFFEAYVIECLSLELLGKAYGLAEEVIYKETGLWQAEYDFLGDRYPVECLKDVIEYLNKKEISCNQYFMINPKKTVVYIADLVRDKGGEAKNICANCRKNDCPNRLSEEVQGKTGKALSYGYQKIFENNDAIICAKIKA